ncbi:uncharacterized protein LOC120928387 [Rana temporaria]|uniref:uncharacterized protein LOC120928387 n=1 Tax=Rana temporaria TaxID=8407 RepID=UPI001AAD0F75|nr:uncharacterized protein LOC120928387 [Rana temporaria]
MTRSPEGFTVICLYLSLASGLVSLNNGKEIYLGDTVTLSCQEGCNKSVTRDDITQIIWGKNNNSHILRFATTLKPNETASNFSEPRYSFQDPTNLRITDAQPSDSGNYSCDLSTSIGNCQNILSLHVSEKPSTIPGSWSYWRWIIVSSVFVIICAAGSESRIEKAAHPEINRQQLQSPDIPPRLYPGLLLPPVFLKTPNLPNLTQNILHHHIDREDFTPQGYLTPCTPCEKTDY